MLSITKKSPIFLVGKFLLLLLGFAVIGFIAGMMLGVVIFPSFEGQDSLLIDIFCVGYIAFCVVLFPLAMTAEVLDEDMPISKAYAVFRIIVCGLAGVVFALELLLYLIIGIIEIFFSHPF